MRILFLPRFKKQIAPGLPAEQIIFNGKGDWMQQKRCGNCRYYQDGVCAVPIWKDGKLYGTHETQPGASCELYEGNDDGKTAEDRH